MNETIKETTKYLFECDFFDDNFDPENDEIHLDKAQELLKSYPWQDIVVEWLDYLYSNCHTPEEVINFANLLFYYDGANKYFPDPYHFLGYLYAHVDMNVYWDRAGDLFDSIAIEVLQFQGLVDLNKEPCYSPLKDEHILLEVKSMSK